METRHTASPGPDAFEQEMLLRITNLDEIFQSQDMDTEYYIGKIDGLHYAIAVYRDCVDRGVINGYQ